MATNEKQTNLVLPVVDPAAPAAAPSQRKSNVKRGVLSVVGILALFALTRSTYTPDFELSIPPCMRSALSAGVATESDVVTDSAVPTLGVPVKIQKRWGQYSPYRPAGKYVQPPKGCVIDQVNILHRHGARFPNDDDDYYKAVERLQNAKKLHGDLKFLEEYEYTLGQDDLIAFGAQQSFESGQLQFERYSHLVTTSLPFIRASGMQRVIDTAGNWSLGFLPPTTESHHPHLPPNAPLPIQIISEKLNDTLNNDCPNAPDEALYTDKWLHQFTPHILKKLKKLARGAKLEEEDVKRLIGICIFETLADASEQMRTSKKGDKKYEGPRSQFCDIFSKKDWKEWEYWGDVEKYYKTGYGNPLGPVQGVGYVNELLARLTESPVVDHTQHNYTLPFPLDRSMYIDFTHENLMVAVYSAMGLFNVSKHLDPKKMPKDSDREWLASRMVPFSSRMVVERLSCPAHAELDAGADAEVGFALEDGLPESGRFVRIFVNDELQPLEFCNNDHSLLKHGSHWQKKHSLCTLEHFVGSQEYARRSGDGDFEKCYN